MPEECPAELLRLIHRCIDPSPSMRPTAQEVAEALLQMPATPTCTEQAAAAVQPKRRVSTGAPRSAITGMPSARAAASPFLVARERQLAAAAQQGQQQQQQQQQEQQEQQQQQQQGAVSPFLAARMRQAAAAQQPAAAPVDTARGAGAASPSAPQQQQSLAAALARAGSGRPPRPGSLGLEAVLEEKMIEEAVAELGGGDNGTASYTASHIYSEGSGRLTPGVVSRAGSSGNGHGSGSAPNSVQRRLLLPTSSFSSPFRTGAVAQAQHSAPPGFAPGVSAAPPASG